MDLHKRAQENIEKIDNIPEDVGVLAKAMDRIVPRLAEARVINAALNALGYKIVKDEKYEGFN